MLEHESAMQRRELRWQKYASNGTAGASGSPGQSIREVRSRPASSSSPATATLASRSGRTRVAASDPPTRPPRRRLDGEAGAHSSLVSRPGPAADQRPKYRCPRCPYRHRGRGRQNRRIGRLTITPRGMPRKQDPGRSPRPASAREDAVRTCTAGITEAPNTVEPKPSWSRKRGRRESDPPTKEPALEQEEEKRRSSADLGGASQRGLTSASGLCGGPQQAERRGVTVVLS